MSIDAAMDATIEPARWLPHGEAMVLIDHVERWDDEGLLATSTRHRGPAHPLADDTGNLAALHLLEYAAQAAAIHLGVAHAHAQSAHTGAAGSADTVPPAHVEPGVIAFVRELWFAVPHIARTAPPLHVEVQRRAAIPGGVAYAFTAWLATDEPTAARIEPAAGGESAGGALLARGVFGVVLGASGLGVSGLGGGVSHAPASGPAASEPVPPRVPDGHVASGRAPAAPGSSVRPASSNLQAASNLPAASAHMPGREVN